MRLQTYVKNNGGYTKSEVMKLYHENRILVNETIQNLSYNLKDSDIITIDNKVIEKKSFVYFLYNKPKGVICTNDENVSGNIKKTIGFDIRIYPVGRLDKDTHGLIILTNDNKFTHYVLESKKIDKEYVVTLKEDVTNTILERLKESIIINGKKTIPATIKKINERQVSITLFEGKYHQVRELVKRAGGILVDLMRIRIGNISLDNYNISEGSFMEINDDIIKNL